MDKESKRANNKDIVFSPCNYQTLARKSSTINVSKVINEKTYKISNQEVTKTSQNTLFKLNKYFLYTEKQKLQIVSESNNKAIISDNLS